MRLYLLPAALAGAMLALCACTGLSISRQAGEADPANRPDNGAMDWQARQARLLALQDWRLSARIGLMQQGKAASATLKWTQRQGDYRLLVIAPFGRGAVELYRQGGVVTLRSDDGQVLSAASAEALLKAHVGWSLPLDGLPYWIRGIPQPGVAVDDMLPDGERRLAYLRQAGWEVAYGRYGQVGEYMLPARLRLENGQLSVRLAIKKWTLP